MAHRSPRCCSCCSQARSRLRSRAPKPPPLRRGRPRPHQPPRLPQAAGSGAGAPIAEAAAPVASAHCHRAICRFRDRHWSIEHGSDAARSRRRAARHRGDSARQSCRRVAAAATTATAAAERRRIRSHPMRAVKSRAIRRSRAGCRPSSSGACSSSTARASFRLHSECNCVKRSARSNPAKRLTAC